MNAQPHVDRALNSASDLWQIIPVPQICFFICKVENGEQQALCKVK